MRDISMSGASVFWTSLVTSLGGQYRLCWCSAGQHCSTGEQFRSDFGSFTLIGPSSSNQDRTCVVGLSCAVDSIRGQDLSTLNQYVILDTCGVASPIPGMPAALHTVGYNAAISRVSVTAVAGQYRLCWCSGPHPLEAEMNFTENWTNVTSYSPSAPQLSWWNQSLVNFSFPSNQSVASYYCQTAEEFRVDVGSLLLVGASSLVSDFTCIAGRDCELDHIVGISLTEGDSIVVLDTCGEPGALLQPRALANGTHASWQTIVTPGGVYRLCWCSASQQCNWAGEFDLDIGRLYVLGPRPLSQDRTCVSGRECAVSGIEVHGAVEAGSIAILSTCGAIEVKNLWAGLPISVTQLQEPGSSIFSANLLTDVDLTAPGGHYKLCWCGSWAGSCDRPEEFNVDFGNFHLVGVFPLQQDRTCFAGATCALTDVSGHLLSESAVLVLETCGVGRATVLRSWWDEASTSSASGSLTSWPAPPSSGPGGQYRLCWCSRPPCNVRDAIVDFGRLTLVGPAPLYQHRTCFSGLPCELRGFKGNFWSGDIWVLATCGTRQGLIHRFGLDGRSAVSMPQSFVDFNFPVTAEGGRYRLCWCSNGALANQSNVTVMRPGCSFAEDFTLDMGSLLLVGMSPITQHRTCIAGQSCHLADLVGYGLSPLDTIAVLDTCGLEPLQQWPAEPSALVEGNGRLSVSWSFVSTAGGQYRLCWCPGLTWTSSEEQDEDFDPWIGNDTLNASGISVQTFQTRCSSMELLKVDFGSLTLIGPTPLFQLYTCVNGQTCELQNVKGLYLEEGDRIQLLETCAVSARGAVPLRMPGGGRLQASAVGNNSLTFSLDTTPISGFGGIYRLCWCSAAVDCSLLESFRVDIGQLTILGAHPPSRDFTCVSGLQCRIDGVQGIFGAGSAFMVLDTCGSGFSIEQGSISQSHTGSSLSWESGILSGSGGQYRLCWCGSLQETQILGDNDTNSSSMLRGFGCGTSRDFRTDAGEIHLVGPMLGQSRTCIAGLLCRLEGLVGYGLVASDRLLVTTTCGSADIPEGFPTTGTAMVLVNSSDLTANSSFWDVIVTAAGGKYRLCWCSQLGASCLASQDFLVDVGELTLLGPNPLEQHRTCISGRACFLGASPDHGMEGLGVDSASDGLLAIPLTSTCGTRASPRVEGVTPYLSIPGGSSPSVVAQAVARISEPGGVYRLCWCSSAGPCMTEHHAVQVGLLTILGPAPLPQDRTCVSGSSCAVDVSGSFADARLEGVLMVLETCGSPVPLPRFLASGLVPLVGSEPESNMTALAISAAGGLYRLCWCATVALPVANTSDINTTGRSLEACNQASDFIVDARASAIFS